MRQSLMLLVTAVTVDGSHNVTWAWTIPIASFVQRFAQSRLLDMDRGPGQMREEVITHAHALHSFHSYFVLVGAFASM
eukprot:4504775-Amphidinium_carterae.3